MNEKAFIERALQLRADIKAAKEKHAEARDKVHAADIFAEDYDKLVKNMHDAGDECNNLHHALVALFEL